MSEVERATGSSGMAPLGTDRELEAGRPGPLGRLSLFYRQVVAELRKVVYPSRDQLFRYTAVVLVFVMIMIAIVSLLDYGLSALVVSVFG